MSNPDEPTVELHGGVATLTYPDGYALDFRRYAREKSGRLAVEVTARHEAMLLHTARIDVLNQRDQEILPPGAAVNGTVADWQSRLQSAIPVLEQLAQGAQHPEPLRRSCLRQSRFPWTRSGRCSARWPVSCARWCKPPTRFVDSPSSP